MASLMRDRVLAPLRGLGHRVASRLRRLSRDRVWSIVLIVPSLLAIAVFVYGMIGWTGWLSLSKANDMSFDMTLRGFQNFEAVFKNIRFQLDMRNTVVFTICFVVASLVMAIASRGGSHV